MSVCNAHASETGRPGGNPESGVLQSRPDNPFKTIAYHVDLRTQVMPVNALKALAKEVRSLGFNALIMEWEATYPYLHHAIISNRYAYTRAQISDFIKYCKNIGLDVIPLQQSLGHVEYILRHERYAYLRADSKDFSQIDPTRIAQARDLFTDLYDDMLSMHDSKYVHIGGDETQLLDCARCRAAWGSDGERAGKSKLYVEYMKMIAEIVLAKGKTPLIWADMILAHPEAIEKMPKGVIYVDWNYGWNPSRFGSDPRTLIDKYHLNFWGAAAIRSAPDDYNVTSWGRHLANQADYIPYAKNAGFSGMVMTSWATSGTYSYEWFDSEIVQLLPIRETYPHSYPQDAFRLNTAAFIESIRQGDAFDPKAFVQQYAQQRFGLAEKESENLWAILTSRFLSERLAIGSEPLSGRRGAPEKEISVNECLAGVKDLQKQMKSLKAKSNLQEFAHYRMQLDLREFYLQFRRIEEAAQSAGFGEKQRIEAVKQLEELLAQSRMLDDRFKTLFEGALYPSEIEQLSEYRTRKIINLYNRLSRNRSADPGCPVLSCQANLE